jgi:hypothetical protein
LADTLKQGVAAGVNEAASLTPAPKDFACPTRTPANLFCPALVPSALCFGRAGGLTGSFRQRWGLNWVPLLFCWNLSRMCMR